LGKLTRAERNIAWIETYCRIPEGRDVSKQVKLREWQKDEIRRIYDNPAGTRRAILSFGRKNAKTTLAAFLLLLHLVGHEARANSQLFSAAQSRDQAAVLFALAAKIVRMSPALAETVAIRDTAKQLFCGELGTLYRALSAEASTAYGLSPVFIVHDELGQVKGPRSDLYDALETATGAQDNPLSIVISTQAPTDADLLSVLIDDAIAGHDPRTVVSLYTASEDLDPFGQDAIKAANPAYGDFLNAEQVNDMAEAARRMPAREAQYRNLVLNQRVTVFSPFVSRAVWAENGGANNIEPGAVVFGGLDLSSTTDLTSLILVSQVEGTWRVQSRFWLPQDGLPDRSKQDRVPYDQWHKEGFLETVPGRSINYDYVAELIKDAFEQYDVQAVAFDRWNFKHFRGSLERAGFDEVTIEERFIEFGQGFASMSPALRSLEDILLNGHMAHGNHPVLTMCAANAVVDQDAAGNRKLTKVKSTGRIDGMVALTMAMSVAVENETPKEPSYLDDGELMVL
jgi:phage terminase large subunit-like protein